MRVVDIADCRDGSMMGKSPDPFLPHFLGKGSGHARLVSAMIPTPHH